MVWGLRGELGGWDGMGWDGLGWGRLDGVWCGV